MTYVYTWPCPRCSDGSVTVEVSGPRLAPEPDAQPVCSRGCELDPSEVEQVEREVYEELMSGGLAA